MAEAARLGDIRHVIGDCPRSLRTSLTFMMSGVARRAWIEGVNRARGPSGLLRVRLWGADSVSHP